MLTKGDISYNFPILFQFHISLLTFCEIRKVSGSLNMLMCQLSGKAPRAKITHHMRVFPY